MNQGTPELSIVIPVLNERDIINTCIARIRESDCSGAAELIVVDGDPAGGTAAAVTDRGVRCVLSGRGRGRQMNCGARTAKGAVLLFLHADTCLPVNACALIAAALRKENIVAGAFSPGFDSKRRIYMITEWYVRLRTRLTRVPFGDQAIFIRRSAFDELGGFSEIPIMEDVDLMKRIKTNGRRIALLPAKVLTSPRRYEDEGILYCTLRNAMLQLLYAVGVSPERLAKWYRPRSPE